MMLTKSAMVVSGSGPCVDPSDVFWALLLMDLQRDSVPSSVDDASDSIDISSWGTPSAYWPSSSCNVDEFFTAQQLILDITLCGDWYELASFLHDIRLALTLTSGLALRQSTSRHAVVTALRPPATSTMSSTSLRTIRTLTSRSPTSRSSRTPTLTSHPRRSRAPSHSSLKPLRPPRARHRAAVTAAAERSKT